MIVNPMGADDVTKTKSIEREEKVKNIKSILEEKGSQQCHTADGLRRKDDQIWQL